MSLWKKIFSRGPSSRTPEETDPVLGLLFPTMDQGNLHPAWQAFTAAHGDVELRWELVDQALQRTISKWPGPVAPMLDSGASSGDPFYLLLRGWWHTNEGWRARGGGKASSVTDEGWRVLRERCALGRRDLCAVAAADPADATPHVMLIRVAMGTSDPKLAEQSFEEARRLAPGSMRCHVAMLPPRSARWWGSPEEVLAFAEEHSARAPAGTDLAGLLVHGHWEVFCTEFEFKAGPAAAKAKLPAVLADIKAACARSVDAPGYQPTLWGPRTRHKAAALCWYGGDVEGTRTQLQAVGDVYWSDPWEYGGGKPQELYLSVRRELGLV